MKKTVLLMGSLFCIYWASGLAVDKTLENLMAGFKSTDWPTVMKAKESIENMEAAGIPMLMQMLNDCSVRKLKNTGDLIYPGTKKFYGHGQIVDHNIDELCIRAGWLLEDLSFRSFGFAGIYLPENELSAFVQSNFSTYYEKNKQEFANLSVGEKRKTIRALSIKNAQEWWASHSSSWNRLNALSDAIRSGDERSQIKALFYMRNGKTRCSGLTREYYKETLEAYVKGLSKNSLKRISENAKLILMDIDYEWLAMKPVG